MKRTYSHKISNKTLDLNYTLGRMHPTDTYRTLHLETTEYPFYSLMNELSIYIAVDLKMFPYIISNSLFKYI